MSGVGQGDGVTLRRRRGDPGGDTAAIESAPTTGNGEDRHGEAHHRRTVVRLGQRAWFPLIPATLIFILATLVDDRQAQSPTDLENSQVSQKQLEDMANLLRKRLTERRKQAAKAGLKDAETF